MEGKIGGNNRREEREAERGKRQKGGRRKGRGGMNYQPKYPPRHQAGLGIILPLSKTLLKYLKEVSISEDHYRSSRND